MFDWFWMLISAALVFVMQAGFLCLESGRIRSKNSINVAAKNISDFIVSTSIFWLFGFGIMFGESVSGWFGSSDFFFGSAHSPEQISFFVFQMMFCGTAATLMSGAVAERMSFIGYLCIAVLLSAVIYPVVGHWAWAGAYSNNASGWLQAMGFVDFAGATMVHSVGGWVALAAIIIIGPRLGRFEQGIRLPPGNNLPLSALGVLLIWFGWIGFNGGSTLELNEQVPIILLNTFVAAAWGGIGAAALNYYHDRYIDVSSVLNGTIAGLVAITACCHLVTPVDSVVIGVVAGIIVFYGALLMETLRLDDALEIIPAHLFAGIWGTLSVALFGDLSVLGENVGAWQQFSIQAFGILVIGIYCFAVSYVGIRLLNTILPLRVSREQEEQGLNVSEHRATTEVLDLLVSMQYQQKQGDFSKPVPEEPFTEVGQIAHRYNQVINRVQSEINHRDDALTQFKESEMRKSAILNSAMDCIISINQKGLITEFNPAAERTFGCLKKQVKGKSFIDGFVQEQHRAEIRESLESGFLSSSGLILNRRNAFPLQRSPNHAFPAEIAITRANSTKSQDSEFTLHIRDVSQRLKLQEKMRFLAYRDPLTELFNRAYFMERLESILSSDHKQHSALALLFLDLDKFKNINDTLGHKAGDELLCEVALRLRKVCGESDVIARWGGDEFVILVCENVVQEKVLEQAERILAAMRQPFSLLGKSVDVPTSIGISLSLEGEHSDADRFIQQADMAMYQAKEQGRDNAQLFSR
ncbi:ammonium transporter [Marinomonas epiphytica]